MTDNLPIALRRTRRSTAGPIAKQQQQQRDATNAPQTPSRGHKKRVRFSDPGPTVETDDDDDTAVEVLTSASTGLTPSMNRTALTPGSKRRRHSNDIFSLDRDTIYSGQVTFLPLRQVLDGRVKRRIRRNGLSEEMNTISAEKRRRAQQTQAELDALRAAVTAKDAEIRRLSGVTEIGDDAPEESVDDLKRQVEQLRQALKSPAPSNEDEECDTSGDTRIGDEAFSGDCVGMDVDFEDDDHFFGEDSVAELACSTPSRRRADARYSFPTPPSTSPLARLAMPLFPHMVTPTSHAAVQVQMNDAEKEELEEELASLHLEIQKLTRTLETYEAMTARLCDKLSPFASSGGSAAEAIMGSRSPSVKVEAQLNNLLKALRERTAALIEFDDSLDKLGFPGDDAGEIIGSLKSAFRSARLELEYLEPGESALPLTASGAAVLDLLLTRLRELSRQNLEYEETIGQFQERESSFRRQLTARVEAMDEMRQEISTLKGKVKLRNLRISELEIGMDKLRGTIKTYTRDIAELEKLAQRLEEDLDQANKSLEEANEERQADADESGVTLGAQQSIAELLEEKLARVLAQTAELEEQLASLQSQRAAIENTHKEEVNTLNTQYGSALALRDTRVSELRLEIDKVNGALRQAHETIQKLRVENGAMSGQIEAERARARVVLDTMKVELERVVMVGEGLMATPPETPVRI